MYNYGIYGSFRKLIMSEEELRETLGYPSEMVSKKTITFLDQHCRNFIAHSPFILLATSDQSGACDVSPRGDAPGFVHILNDSSLLIPERPGNRRLDTLTNIVSNPYIGLIFIIPGLEETLRINGRACVVKDEELLQEMAVKGKMPLVGIGVEVNECYVHCAKAFKRSQLWNPDSWPNHLELPSISQMLADHVNDKQLTAEEISKRLEESYTMRMY